MKDTAVHLRFGPHGHAASYSRPCSMDCALAQVCKQWAAAAEVLLSRECAARRWALPRRPRGADSLPRAFPARSLYM